MTNQARGQPASDHIEPWVGIVMITAICFFSAAVWGLIRAYTGLFDVPTLRIVVAALVVIVPLLFVWAFVSGLAGRDRLFLVVLPILALLPVGGGEWLGHWLLGRPIVWQRFNLSWLVVGLAFALAGCVASFVKSKA